MSNSSTKDAEPLIPEVDCQTVLITAEQDISALIGALNDSSARTIIEALDDEALSAQELSNKYDLSLSTTYRRVNELSQLGILTEKTTIDRHGKHISKYQRRVDELVIRATGDGITVHVFLY
jgi:DNA-binding transcriptional ArsR family regulator